MEILRGLPESFPDLFDVSDSIKIVEVAKKYDDRTLQTLERVPEYTVPQGTHSYHCSKVKTSWTQGFFPGLLWLMVERKRLLPTAVSEFYPEKEIVRLARRYQNSFRFMARNAYNHDQGFRFQYSYGKDLDLMGTDAEPIQVIIEASDSLVDRFSEKMGCIRSWDTMRRDGQPDVWRKDNMDQHYLVIIDNMMNLDMLYLATDLTRNPLYAEIATKQAERSLVTHIRSDWTTYHVVDLGHDGNVKTAHTHQGYSDDSCWSRGQAWGIYGFAQCAKRTGNKAFLTTSRKLADRFMALLPQSGVPWWDFDAPKPCPYDASAGTIAACAMLLLFEQLLATDPQAAEGYLSYGFQLMKDIIRVCKTGRATLGIDGVVDWGADDWETILQHSTINGNRFSPRPLMDHGLVYADYYFVEFGNIALRLSAKVGK